MRFSGANVHGGEPRAALPPRTPCAQRLVAQEAQLGARAYRLEVLLADSIAKSRHPRFAPSVSPAATLLRIGCQADDRAAPHACWPGHEHAAGRDAHTGADKQTRL